MGRINKQSEWISDADYRAENRKWLRYSSNVARRIIAILKESEDLNQTALAEKVGVSAQYISNVLKGQENLSLKTIAKLSEALNTELISFPDYKYSSKPVLREYVIRMNADEPSYSRAENDSLEFHIRESQTSYAGAKEICTTLNLSEQ